MTANAPTELEVLRAKARLHQLEMRQSNDELLSMISSVQSLRGAKSLLPLAGAGAGIALLLLLLRRHRTTPLLAALGVVVDALRLAALTGVIGNREKRPTLESTTPEQGSTENASAPAASPHTANGASCGPSPQG